MGDHYLQKNILRSQAIPAIVRRDGRFLPAKERAIGQFRL
jgi:hypothetical protein